MVQLGLAQSFSAFYSPRNQIPITYVSVTILVGFVFVNFQPRIEAKIRLDIQAIVADSVKKSFLYISEEFYNTNVH